MACKINRITMTTEKGEANNILIVLCRAHLLKLLVALEGKRTVENISNRSVKMLFTY